MRRLVLASILLAACADNTPLSAPSAGTVRLSIETAFSRQAGAQDQSIAIRAFYRRNGGGEVDLTVSPDRLLLQSGTTSERTLTVNIGACFNDDLREPAAGEACVLHVGVQLLGADGLALSGDQQQVIVPPNGTTDASLAFVLASPEILLAPASVSFTAVEQGTAPAAASVAVSGSSGLVLGVLSTTTQFTGAGNWLSATIAATNAVVLQVTTTDLQPGPHAAVVTVRSSRSEVPPRDIAVTFNVTARPPQALNLTVQGSGNGSVTSSPAGLNCTRLNNQNSGSCTFAFAFGAQVTLTATPAQAHTFTGWSGACSGTATCIVAMNQVQNVTATFTAPPPQQLGVALAGTGSGSVTSTPTGINCTLSNNQNTGTCAFAFGFGVQVTLNATPVLGHTFEGWGGACSGMTACIVTMNSSQNVTATFSAPPPQQLTVVLAGTGGGSVISTPGGIACTRSNNQNSGACGGAFAFAAQVTLTPTPQQGHTFSGWSGACSGTGACVITMTSSQNVTATFAAPPQQQLTVTLAGTGGGSVASAPAGINCTRSNNQNSGTCTAAFIFGTQVTVTPTPAQGHTFAGWSGDCSGTGACVVGMNQSRSVTATFEGPVVTVAPASLSFTAATGANPAPATATFQVTNTGAGTLNWSAVETAPWFVITPASGALTAGQSQVVTVTVASANLPAGKYADTITVSAPGLTSRQVAIALTVTNLAPTISNLTSTLRQVNDSTNCSNGGSSFIASFNFSDPDGDVTMALATIRSTFVFSQGSSGTIVWPTPGFFYSVTGNGFSGTASMFLCTVFATSTSITNTFTLFDGAGRASNSLAVTTFKPPGSN